MWFLENIHGRHSQPALIRMETTAIVKLLGKYSSQRGCLEVVPQAWTSPSKFRINPTLHKAAASRSTLLLPWPNPCNQIPARLSATQPCPTPYRAFRNSGLVFPPYTDIYKTHLDISIYHFKLSRRQYILLMHTKGREGRFCKIIILGTQTMLILMERTTFFFLKKITNGKNFQKFQ